MYGCRRHDMSFTNQITLKTAVVLPFVMIFLITIGVIVGVQKYSYEEMVDDISSKQLSSLNANVEQRLISFLDEPFQASLALSHTIGFSQFYSADDVSKIEGYLLASFETLYRPLEQIDVIGFGGEQAEYVGFRKEIGDSFTLMVKDNRTQQNLVIYSGKTINQDIRSTIADYDPRTRPWYTPVAQSLSPSWSPIYTNVDERQEITLSALAPVFSMNKFIGVLVTDVKIDTFNAFLASLQQKTHANVYIIDPEKRLVAHSNTSTVVSWGTELSAKGERLLAIENANPVIQASAHYIDNHDKMLSATLNKFETVIDGTRYFNHLTPFKDKHGIEWFIGVSISETDLLGRLPENQQNSWIIGSIVSLIGIGIGLIAFNRITTPITATAAAAQHLAKGDWESNMPKAGNIYETSLLVYSFNEMANNLKASFKALHSQLIYDSLTKLYSREGLIDNFSQSNQINGSLLLIGIDKFRDINDSLGHQQGDLLLQIIAEKLRTLFASTSCIARTGGDEFAIYIPSLQQKNEAQSAANSILQMFAVPFSMHNEKVVVNASIGIVLPNDTLHTMALWLRNGSIALSHAKQERSRICYYSPEMDDVSRKRTQMLTQIKLAIENKEYIPHYQPIVNLSTGDIIGAEALARWVTPSGDIIPPLDFIPIAEESGFIGLIGEQILYQACFDTMQGIKMGKWGSTFKMHVNLSVNQLSQPQFVYELKATLERTGLEPNNLALEITESRIVDNDPVILANMNKLKELGIHIAIDDFGTGYSSLSYLHQLPFDCLKIDRAFVSQLEQTNLSSSVVAAIINMTRGFNVEIVAEGIETKEQVHLLTMLNCTQGQGFLFSKAIPFNEWSTDMVNIKAK
ncbi:bifunctional diguanylate cyclase/phosphodiesterase [Vibrio anguillarum]|uniref:bifunctional diguanylate cyclase/phosphodiesterase n=1 Tax=Vibrio anguillarum TaxID=55601 RepID=UPI000B54152A|nr:EAL domain-containing protein [Vibrio anguillarum]ASG02465.1 diguanylate cyclase [Vibrio anguillarum]